MKNLLKTILLIALPFTCIIGQENNDNQEVGIRLNSLDNYDLIYKNQISENKYFRLRTVDFNFSATSRDIGDTEYRIGSGIALGIERRKALTNKFDFILGYEAITGINYYKSGESSLGDYYVGVGLVIGFNYKLSDRINLGVETIPTLRHTRNFGDVESRSITDLRLNTSNVNLLATYRF